MPVVPAAEYDNLHLTVLWTGVEEAALSHEAALSLYELGDVKPAMVHVTVPKRRRIRRSGAQGIEIHRQDLAPRQIGRFEQIPAVKHATAISQGIDLRTPTYLLRQALESARRTGRITPSEGDRLREKPKRRETAH